MVLRSVDPYGTAAWDSPISPAVAALSQLFMKVGTAASRCLRSDPYHQSAP